MEEGRIYKKRHSRNGMDVGMVFRGVGKEKACDTIAIPVCVCGDMHTHYLSLMTHSQNGSCHENTHDYGWKSRVVSWPGERVRAIGKFLLRNNGKELEVCVQTQLAS